MVEYKRIQMTVSEDVLAASLTLFVTGTIGFVVWVVKKFFEVQRDSQESIEKLTEKIGTSHIEIEQRVSILENDDRVCRSARTRATNETIKDLEFKNAEQDTEMNHIKEDFEKIQEEFKAMDSKVDDIKEKLNKFEVTQAKQGEILEKHKELLEHITKMLETAFKVKM